MKKLTTTTVQLTLSKRHGTLTIGLDLGDRFSFYCLLDWSAALGLVLKDINERKRMIEALA
jgi:hypothetical protein